MRPRLADILLLTAMAFGSTGVAVARESDRQQPMQLQAEDGDATLAEDGDSTFSGDVAITQGTLRIAAGKMVISRKAGDVARVVFEGQPASMQQENDNGAQMRAQANKIEYDVTAETVVLIGNDDAGNWTRAHGLAPPAKLQELLQKAGAEAAAEGRG